MLKGYNQATISDLNGTNDLSLEINFSGDPENSKCAKIRLAGNEAVISLDELHAFVFAVATEDQQADLIPVRQVEVQKVMKWHLVEAKKDIRKGEKIKVRCETNVPVEIYNGIIGGMDKWRAGQNKSSILIPK